MAEARKKTEAVIQNRDVTDVDSVVERLDQAPFLDEQANEFRGRLKSILARAVTAAAAATPVPGDGPRRQPPLEDQKLGDDFAQWNSEYEEWMKQAVQTYLSGQSE